MVKSRARRPGVLFAALVALALGGWWLLDHRSEEDAGDTRPRAGRTVAAPEGAIGGSPLLVGAAPKDTPTRAGDDDSLVFGRVLDASTKSPVAGALLVAFGYEGLARHEVVTQADGSFQIAKSAGREGAWHLSITAEGYAKAEVARARTEAQPLEILLEKGGSIEGRVVAGEESLPDLRVTVVRRLFPSEEDVDMHRFVYAQAVPGDLLRAVTEVSIGRDGRFRVGPLAAGAYALVLAPEDRPPWAERGGADSWDLAGGIEVRDGAVTDVGDLRLPRLGTLVLNVVDATTGEPIRSAEFEAMVELDRREIAFPLQPRSLQPDGSYVVPALLDAKGLALGAMRITVTSRGYGPWSTSLSGGEDGSRFEVRLSRAASVEGTVYADAGAAAAGAPVFVVRDVDQVVLAATAASATGRFSVDGLPAGVDLEVVAFDSSLGGVLSLVPLRLDPGETRRLTMGGTSAPAVRGIVRAAGVPVERAFLNLDGPTGRRMQVRTGADGRFRFDGLVPGEYELMASGGSPPGDATRTFPLAEGEVADLSLDFAWAVEGTVEFETLAGEHRSRPEEYVRVEARRPGSAATDPTWRAEALVGEDGRFLLRLPGAGPWEVAVTEPGYLTPEPVRLEVGPGPEVPSIRIRVLLDPQDGEIKLEVRDAETGEPPPDVSFRYAWRTTSGAGTVAEDGVVRETEAGFGTHRFVVDAPLYVSQVVLAEITRTVRSVRRVVPLVRSGALRVVAVSPGSNALGGGLRPGDILLRYGERPLGAFADLREAVGSTAPGDTVRMEGLRDGVPQTWTVRGGRLGVEVANHPPVER